MLVAARVPVSIWNAALLRLTLALTLVVVATAFEALAVATVLPQISAALGGLSLYGWTFSAFMLTNLVGITLGGRECDRVGPAWPFAAGAALFVAGLVVSGFAPTMQVIVAGRALQGLGAGLLSSSAYASIALAYSVELQPRMLATLSSAWVVPGLVGPGVAGWVAQHVGYRWVFLGLCPCLVIASALALPALRGLRPNLAVAPGAGRVALAAQLGLGASVALAGLSLRPWALGLPLLLLGAALAIRALRRLLPAGTLRARPGLPAAIASMALLNFAFFGTEAFVPLALTEVRRAPVSLSGLALTAAALSWTLGAWLPVRLVPRRGRRPIVFAGLLLLLAGIGATCAVLQPWLPAAIAVAAWAVAGLGMGLAFTTTTAAILESATAGQEGDAAASLQLAQVLGTALATGVGGAILAAPLAAAAPGIGIAAIDALMLGAVTLAIWTARGIPNQHSAS